MLDRFGRTDDPNLANAVAKSCLLVPPSTADLTAAAALADTAVTVSRFAKGLAEYRQAHFTATVECMQKLLAQRNTPEGEMRAQLVLAMAQHRLRRPGEAHAALNKALELKQTKLPQLDNGYLGSEWVHWLQSHILLHEAQALIKGEPES